MGLGGNTPGTLEAFSRVKASLALLLEDARFSSLYRSAPLLDTQQEPFWNAVIIGRWSGTPESLLERLLMGEAGEGRKRDVLRPKGPRILDLDLLTFGAVVTSSPRLSLPHPGLVHRRFALEPLVEVQPEGRDPRTGLGWGHFLGGLADQGVDRVLRTW